MADSNRQKNPAEPKTPDKALISTKNAKSSPELHAERAEQTLRNTTTAFFIFAAAFLVLLILILVFIVAVL